MQKKQFSSDSFQTWYVAHPCDCGGCSALKTLELHADDPFFSAAYLPYPTAAESAGSAITTMDPPFVVGCGCSSVDVWAEMHRTSDSHVTDLFLDRCGYI